jgi:DnaK suppressor protein
MVVELPPGYQPSADEEFMNAMQVEYFRQRLALLRADLRRVPTRFRHRAHYHPGGDVTDPPVQPQNGICAANRERIRAAAAKWDDDFKA